VHTLGYNYDEKHLKGHIFQVDRQNKLKRIVIEFDCHMPFNYGAVFYPTDSGKLFMELRD
jgi:hypothetical protein